MALLPGPTVFNREQMQKARYWYERLPYTVLDPSLAPLQTPLVNETQLDEDVPNRLVIVSRLSASTAAGVSWNITLERRTWQEAVAAFPPALEPLAAGEDDGWRTHTTLQLVLVNGTGAALSSVFQATYHGAVKQLTVAEKQFYGVPLTPMEQALAEQYGVARLPPQGWAGLRPLSLGEQLTLLWRRAIVEEQFQAYVFPTVGTGSAQPFLTVSPEHPGDEVLVWHTAGGGLANSSDVGKGVQLSTRRDNQDALNVVLLDNAAPAFPWRPWVTATSRFQWTVSAQTATTGAVAVRLHWYRVRLTPVLRVVLGLAPAEDLAGPDRQLYDLIRVGVVV